MRHKYYIFFILLLFANTVSSVEHRSPFGQNNLNRQVEVGVNIVESTIDLGTALGIKIASNKGFLIDLPNKLPSQGVESVSVAVSVGKLSKNLLLDLELNALEKEHKTKNIAKPKLLTLDNEKAIIEKGLEIPYKTTNKDGAASTSFKKAVLRLEVLPRILANNMIMLDLNINQDTPKLDPSGGDPAINTNKITSKVIVKNGETIMLGGIFKDVQQEVSHKVPFLSALPLFGALFRNKLQVARNSEIVVFVTPKIIY